MQISLAQPFGLAEMKCVLFIIGLVLILTIDIGVGVQVKKYNINPYSNRDSKEQQQNQPVEGPFIVGARASILWFLDFSDRNERAMTAASTFVIAIFTIVLAIATGVLVKMAWQQEKTSRIHERAYVILGPPFGARKIRGFLSKVLQPPESPNKAKNFTGPWSMVIHNYGRTPAFVTEIKWGLSRRCQFREDIFVSEIVKKPKSYLPSDAVFEIAQHVDEAYPPSTTPIFNRHVQIKDRSRYIGWVFFARVDYNDVFGDSHHSTCKILLTKDHSEPLPGCHSQDKS